jgi:hypothetical protein
MTHCGISSIVLAVRVAATNSNRWLGVMRAS